MGNPSILMWNKVQYNLNNFTSLEFLNLTIFHPKIRFKNFWKDKIFKIPSGIRTQDTQFRSELSNPLRYALS